MSRLVDQVNRLEALVGMTCRQAALAGDEALMLLFGQTNAAGAKRMLVGQCWWRLETPDRVIAGSGDLIGDPAHHDQRAGAAHERLERLAGCTLLRYSVDLPSCMLRAWFSGDLLLWLFPDNTRVYAGEDERELAWYVAEQPATGAS